MGSNPLQGRVIFNQFSGEQAQLHDGHDEVVERIRWHGWHCVVQFPRGCWTPVCNCGWFDPLSWFPTKDAAEDSICGRLERELREAGTGAFRHGA